jgi:hypothetical protein
MRLPSLRWRREKRWACNRFGICVGEVAHDLPANRWIGIDGIEEPFDVGDPGCVIVWWHLIVIAKVCDSHPASDGKRAKGITYISGSRIFSALEVAGDVFSRANVGQQLVEPRRRAR